VNLRDVLADALARIVRAHEALRDGDASFAVEVLRDLEDDLWRALEPEEGRT
jgi:hypothetical protein